MTNAKKRAVHTKTDYVLFYYDARNLE